KPLKQGAISTDMFIKIIEALHLARFDGMTLTGGEPLLNPEWDLIVNKAKEIGMSRIGVTTNGTLLNTYLQKKGHLPKGLTLLTISLDTFDADRLKAITRRGKFEEVMKGLSEAKKDNPKLKIRANKVLLRSDMESLLDYIEFCEKSGVIDEINLLNLILKDQQSKRFFEEEFISASEVLDFFSKHTKYKFSIDNKYEFNTKLSSDLRIILKDTNLTLRNNQCINCPIYCQEGFYTVRVATDGNITACPDHKAELSSIDGVAELKRGTLFNKVNQLVKTFETAEPKETLDDFFVKNNIKLRKGN
ncbi:MAG: radical SAM protein, partial [Proteobacteria bacterium]|nr:radical SAM protein [Pseudomonadota bacterium]